MASARILLATALMAFALSPTITTTAMANPNAKWSVEKGFPKNPLPGAGHSTNPSTPVIGPVRTTFSSASPEDEDQIQSSYRDMTREELIAELHNTIGKFDDDSDDIETWMNAVLPKSPNLYNWMNSIGVVASFEEEGLVNTAGPVIKPTNNNKKKSNTKPTTTTNSTNTNNVQTPSVTIMEEDDGEELTNKTAEVKSHIKALLDKKKNNHHNHKNNTLIVEPFDPEAKHIRQLNQPSQSSPAPQPPRAAGSLNNKKQQSNHSNSFPQSLARLEEYFDYQPSIKPRKPIYEPAKPCIALSIYGCSGPDWSRWEDEEEEEEQSDDQLQANILSAAFSSAKDFQARIFGSTAIFDEEEGTDNGNDDGLVKKPIKMIKREMRKWSTWDNPVIGDLSILDQGLDDFADKNHIFGTNHRNTFDDNDDEVQVSHHINIGSQLNPNIFEENDNEQRIRQPRTDGESKGVWGTIKSWFGVSSTPKSSGGGGV